MDAILTQRTPQAGFLGITLEVRPVLVTVPANADRKFNGSVVNYVTPGSPAEKAGIQVGDVIILFNAKTIAEPFQLMREIRRVRAGETNEFDIIRGDRRMTIKVTFGPRPKGGGI